MGAVPKDMMVSKILLLLDGSAFANSAAKYAVELAKACNAELTAFHVIHSSGAKPLAAENVEKEKARQAKLCFEAARQIALAGKVGMEEKIALSRSITDAISEEIEAGGYDLAVIGSHGLSGFKKLLLGSVTESILKRKACPTLVV